MAGEAEVVVTDGFTGNVFIKTSEAVSKMLAGMIVDQIKANPLTMLGGLLAKPAFGRVKQQLDPAQVGGAVLLGVKGVVIVGHSRSNAIAIKNAIGQACLAIRGELLAAIRQGLEGYQASG
jgi:glycerol-3-phosphate acyltransferase PlsX